MPPKTPKQHPGEMPIQFEGGLPNYQMNIEWDKRVSLRHLLHVMSGTEPNMQATGEVTAGELAIIDPVEITEALYVGSRTNTDRVYNGLVFPPEDFSTIVFNAGNLAERAKSATEKSRQHLQSLRAAGPSKLQAVIKTMEARTAPLADRRQALEVEATKLMQVHDETKIRGGGAAHYRADKLYPLVIDAKGFIERMVEVAGCSKSWSEDEHRLATRALTATLLGHRGDTNLRISKWTIYTDLAHRYARSRAHLLRGSQNRVEQERRKYESALEHARATT